MFSYICVSAFGKWPQLTLYKWYTCYFILFFYYSFFVTTAILLPCWFDFFQTSVVVNFTTERFEKDITWAIYCFGI